MSYYGDAADARRLAYNVLTADFPTAEIEEYMTIWTKWINMKTHSTWDASNDIYDVISYIIEILAAIDIMKHYGGPDAETFIKSLQGQVDILIQGVLDESTEIDVDTDTLEISRTEFKTYPKNPDAIIPRGRLSKTGYTGSESQAYLDTLYSKYVD